MYRKQKQQNGTINQIESTTRQGALEAEQPVTSRRSSACSIYDEIEFYQAAGRNTEHVQPTAYTVLTRDPYAYDELYGPQRIAILMDPSSTEEDKGKSEEMRHTRAWTSLPIDLHQVRDEEIPQVDQCEYVDMLPNHLEVNTSIKEKTVAKKGLSKKMNEVVGLRNTNKHTI